MRVLSFESASTNCMNQVSPLAQPWNMNFRIEVWRVTTDKHSYLEQVHSSVSPSEIRNNFPLECN